MNGQMGIDAPSLEQHESLGLKHLEDIKVQSRSKNGVFFSQLSHYCSFSE